MEAGHYQVHYQASCLCDNGSLTALKKCGIWCRMCFLFTPIKKEASWGVYIVSLCVIMVGNRSLLFVNFFWGEQIFKHEFCTCGLPLLSWPDKIPTSIRNTWPSVFTGQCLREVGKTSWAFATVDAFESFPLFCLFSRVVWRKSVGFGVKET